MVVFVETLGVCGSKHGHRGKMAETRWKMVRGIWSCYCQGPDVWPSYRMFGTPDVRWIRADVRAPGSGTNTINSTGKRATPGQNSDDLVDENCGEDGGKLDPHVAKHIHGSNPTKLNHTNKSQKNWGYFWWGIFRFRTKTSKSS